jgi:hypothetical protein
MFRLTFPAFLTPEDTVTSILQNVINIWNEQMMDKKNKEISNM